MNFTKVVVASLIFVFTGCSSAPDVKQQKYAKLRSEKTFEYELKTVWKATEAALKNHKIVEKDEEDGMIRTDWVFTRSKDKYIEFKVNDFPRKQYLQTRLRYQFRLEKVLGGTRVSVEADEEIERLDSKGQPLGYESIDEADRDTGRLNQWLDQIQNSILSLPNT